MARCGDFTHELGIALDLPADHKEDRGSAGASERREHGRGALPMRAVVEAEQNTALARDCPRDREGGGQARNVRRQCRGPLHDRRASGGKRKTSPDRQDDARVDASRWIDETASPARSRERTAASRCATS